MSRRRGQHAGVRRGDVVHHIYLNGPRQDLVPFCGITPGPEGERVWHTGHAEAELLAYSVEQHTCCVECTMWDADDL